jgi:murein DD-endopeptidase MepM/ murein hydrolase activator NlpD
MPNKEQEKFTVLVIPHSARPMAALRLSSRIVQTCCVFLIITFLSLTVFAARYAQMTAHLHELRDLRLLTQVQDEQLRALTLSANQLQDRLQQLAQLDAELRRMLRLEDGDHCGDIEALLAASKQVTIAGTPVVATLPAVEVQSLTVATSTLSAAGLLAGTLEVLQGEMEGRLISLEDVQIAAAEQLAYEAAKPSIWPTQGRITSRYGYRSSPFGTYREFHPAIDIAAPIGTPVVATGDGRIIFTGWRTDLGNTVIIDHGYNLRTLYGHVAKVAISVGDRVKKGQVIAYVGSTGRSTGPHVHYEVHLRGTQVNPAPYLQ